jgi:Reverse transcriptase (RNA-dependent DNA polymerase)
MQEEFDSLIQNNTWKLLPLPNKRKALGGKWVYKRKRVVDSLGQLSTRYKARWVAKGFLQRHGVDFDQTWASVVRPMTYKALFAHASANY